MQPSHKKTSHFPFRRVFSEQDAALACGGVCVIYNSSCRRASISEHRSATTPARFGSPHSSVALWAEEGWQQGPASLRHPRQLG